jgi:hypothetical protein
LIYTDLLLSKWRLSEIGQVFDEFFEDFPLTQRRFGQFVAHHRKTLSRTPMSLLLPKSLGGLSTVGYLDFYKDRRIHHFVYDVLSENLPSGRKGSATDPVSDYLEYLGFKSFVHAEHDFSCVTSQKVADIVGRIVGCHGFVESEPTEFNPCFRYFFQKKFIQKYKDFRQVHMSSKPPIYIHRCWRRPDVSRPVP